MDERGAGVELAVIAAERRWGESRAGVVVSAFGNTAADMGGGGDVGCDGD